MDGPLAQGFLGLTAFQAEGCGGGFAADFKKRGAAPPQVVWKAFIPAPAAAPSLSGMLPVLCLPSDYLIFSGSQRIVDSKSRLHQPTISPCPRSDPFLSGGRQRGGPGGDSRKRGSCSLSFSHLPPSLPEEGLKEGLFPSLKEEGLLRFPSALPDDPCRLQIRRLCSLCPPETRAPPPAGASFFPPDALFPNRAAAGCSRENRCPFPA